MRTTIDIENELKSMIPSELTQQYAHLTYAEMAEIAELQPYADALLRAEQEWNELEGQ